MGEHVQLTAADGHKMDAYVSRPESQPKAGLVVVQEIFGVNAHIRSVADGFANDGFLVVAPALFDRIQPGIELGYDPADVQKAMSLAPKTDINKSLLDVGAAMAYAAESSGKKVGGGRLLFWGQAGVARGHAAAAGRGDRLLRRTHRKLRLGETLGARDAALRQRRRAYPRFGN